MDFLQPNLFCIFHEIIGYMLLLRKLIFLILFTIVNIGCEKKTSDETPIFITLEEAKESDILLATYRAKDYEAVKSAYSYSWFEKQVLLLKTNINIEEEAKFLALDKTGKTGRVFATDSTYMISIDNAQLLNKQPLILYEFAVEKPNEKYQLSLTDSLILEQIF